MSEASARPKPQLKIDTEAKAGPSSSIVDVSDADPAPVQQYAALLAAQGDDPKDIPPFVKAFLEANKNRDPGKSADSALCISAGLISATAVHVPVAASAAKEQRAAYLDFLGRDALEELVSELSLNIQQALGGKPLSRGMRHDLSVCIDDGPWVDGVKAGAVLTLGRHPRCGLQVAEPTTSFVSRLQCIVVRARGRLVVYDMCSLNGTEALLSSGDAAAARTSKPDDRVLLVFPWGPSSELTLNVRCDVASLRVRLKEPPAPTAAASATQPSATPQEEDKSDDKLSATLSQHELQSALAATSLGDSSWVSVARSLPAVEEAPAAAVPGSNVVTIE